MTQALTASGILPAKERSPKLLWRDAQGDRSIHVEVPEKRSDNRRAIVFGTLIGKVDVVVDDPTVSPIHAEIEIVEGAGADGEDLYWLRDLGSKNGTFVESVEVRVARLRPMQTVRLGQVELRFADSAPGERDRDRDRDADRSDITRAAGLSIVGSGTEEDAWMVRVAPHMLDLSHRVFRERWAEAGERFFLARKLAKYSRNVSRVSREIELARTYTHKLIKKYGL